MDKLLNEITPFAKKRIAKVKKKLSEKLSGLDTKTIDENRFEQELIYYLEKQAYDRRKYIISHFSICNSHISL